MVDTETYFADSKDEKLFVKSDTNHNYINTLEKIDTKLFGITLRDYYNSKYLLLAIPYTDLSSLKLISIPLNEQFTTYKNYSNYMKSKSGYMDCSSIFENAFFLYRIIPIDERNFGDPNNLISSSDIETKEQNDLTDAINLQKDNFNNYFTDVSDTSTREKYCRYLLNSVAKVLSNYIHKTPLPDLAISEIEESIYYTD